jgi:hypothetical protein
MMASVALAVTDDELALTAADRDHGVDGLEARLHGLVDRLALHDAGRLELHAAAELAVDGALAVDGLAERVHHAADEGGAHGHVDDAAGALDRVAFADLLVAAEDGDADVVVFEVEHEAHQLAGELHQLAGHGALETVHAGDTVTDGEHGTGLHHFDGLLVRSDLLLDDLRDLFSAQLHRATS